MVVANVLDQVWSNCSSFVNIRNGYGLNEIQQTLEAMSCAQFGNEIAVSVETLCVEDVYGFIFMFLGSIIFGAFSFVLLLFRKAFTPNLYRVGQAVALHKKAKHKLEVHLASSSFNSSRMIQIT